MGVLKSFLIGVVRIAAIMVVVVVVLCALGWGVYAIWQRHEASLSAALAEPKKWPTLKIEPLSGLQLDLSTMWRDGLLFYQFDVDGYPPELAAVRDAPDERPAFGSLSWRDTPENNPAWTVQFLDQHGFKVFEYRVPLLQMTRIVDAEGEAAGLHTNDSTHMSVDNYRRVASWAVGWNFRSPRHVEPTAPEPTPPVPASGSPPLAPQPKWRNVALWRKLKLGISKEQVREILGEPGKVVEAGFGTTWFYGDFNGDVNFDSRGAVTSWSEP